MNKVSRHLLKDLDKKERFLLRWLLSDRVVDRSRFLCDLREQFLEWSRSPEHVSPLSQRQFEALARRWMSYRQYRHLLDAVGESSRKIPLQ